MKPVFKSKSLPGLSKEELNKQTDAYLARSQYMEEAHEGENRKQISKESGEKLVKHNRESGYYESEEFKQMCSKNGKNTSKKTMENGTAIFGLTKKERVANAKLGGKTNSPKQKEARKKQFKKHFQTSGTLAAAESARKRRIKKIENILPLLPNDWFTIKDFDRIKKENKITRLNPHGTCNDTMFFNVKKVKGKFYYKKH